LDDSTKSKIIFCIPASNLFIEIGSAMKMVVFLKLPISSLQRS